MNMLGVVLMICAELPAATELQSPADAAWNSLPSMESAQVQVQLDWNDLRSLLEALQPAKEIEEAPEAPSQPPPFDWAMRNADYAASVDGNSMKVEASIALDVLKSDGWVKVPILKNSVAPVSMTLDGEEVALLPEEDGWLSLMIEQPGFYLFEATFYLQTLTQEGVVTAEFPCPETPMTHMTLDIGIKDAQLSATDALNVAVQRREDGLNASLTFRATDKIAVKWVLPAVLEKMRAQTVRPKEKPRVACTVSTLATITEGYLSCSSALNYDVLSGDADTFHLQMPKGVNVLDLRGQGSIWSLEETDEAQEITIKLNHAITADYELTLRYEMPLEEKVERLTVPELCLVDVVRQAGHIGITARSNVVTSPGAEITGLNRVDITELPVALRSMSGNPILLAYKYTGEHYELPIEVRRLSDVEVRVASIDYAQLTTMFTEEGVVVTRAQYAVRNNLKQFLRLELGDDTEIWSAEVGGQLVKPAREDDSGAILIPLNKSVANQRQLGTFGVEIIYMQQAEKTPRLFGTHALRAPVADILVNETMWEVLLPESQGLYRADGDLKAVTMSMDPTVESRHSLSRGGPASYRKETVMKIREGIERFMITDINNTAGSTSAQSARSYHDKPLSMDRASDITVAGVLPVRVNLPEEGVSHHFRRLMTLEDESMQLQIGVYNNTLRAFAQKSLSLLLVFTGIGAGLLLIRLMRGAQLPKRYTLLLLLACIALPLLQSALGASMLGTFLKVMLLAAATVGADKLRLLLTRCWPVTALPAGKTPVA